MKQPQTTVSEEFPLGPVSLAHDDARAIVIALVARSPRANSMDTEGLFRGRYCLLIANVIPALVWMRDQKALTLDMPTIARAFSYDLLCSMAVAHSFPLGQDAPAGVAEVLLDDMPQGLTCPLIGQVHMIPGFDQDAPFTGPNAAFAREWHGYVASHFASENLDETSGQWLDLPNKPSSHSKSDVTPSDLARWAPFLRAISLRLTLPAR